MIFAAYGQVIRVDEEAFRAFHQTRQVVRRNVSSPLFARSRPIQHGPSVASRKPATHRITNSSTFVGHDDIQRWTAEAINDWNRLFNRPSTLQIHQAKINVLRIQRGPTQRHRLTQQRLFQHWSPDSCLYFRINKVTNLALDWFFD